MKEKIESKFEFNCSADRCGNSLLEEVREGRKSWIDSSFQALVVRIFDRRVVKLINQTNDVGGENKLDLNCSNHFTRKLSCEPPGECVSPSGVSRILYEIDFISNYRLVAKTNC